MFMGTLEPFMDDVHVLENESSTILSSAAITEKFVPTILQNGSNYKLVSWINNFIHDNNEEDAELYLWKLLDFPGVFQTTSRYLETSMMH